MPNRFAGLLNRTVAVLLALIGIICVTLTTLFNFVAVSQLSLGAGLILFVSAVVLLMVGYVLGIVLVGLFGVFILNRLLHVKNTLIESRK